MYINIYDMYINIYVYIYIVMYIYIHTYCICNCFPGSWARAKLFSNFQCQHLIVSIFAVFLLPHMAAAYVATFRFCFRIPDTWKQWTFFFWIDPALQQIGEIFAPACGWSLYLGKVFFRVIQPGWEITSLGDADHCLQVVDPESERSFALPRLSLCPHFLQLLAAHRWSNRVAYRFPAVFTSCSVFHSS